MSRVNPPPALRIPPEWFNDPAKRPFLEQIIRILFQLWGDIESVGEIDAIRDQNFYPFDFGDGQGMDASNYSIPDAENDQASYDVPAPIQTPEQFFQVFEDDMKLGEQSTLNSSTATLASGATFTGVSEQNDYPDVMCSCFSSSSGTLYFEFSVNGTDWRTFPVKGFSVSAGIHEFHTAVKGPRYFRARFVNGTTSQSTFQLFVYYGTFAKAPNAPLNQGLGLDTDALTVRPTDFQDEVTRGLRPGVKQLNKFAYRTDVDTTDGEALVIADNTTNTPTVLTAASTFTITYNSGTDGSGTTGAFSLLFDYLDGSQALQQATHTLGASGSDTTTFSGLGINRVVVLASGSANINTNDINITATTGGSVQAFIPAGESVTEQMWIHLPTNSVGVAKFLFINALRISGGSSPRVTFRIKVYSRITNTEYQVFRYQIDTDVTNDLVLVDPVNFPFSAGDVVWVTAESDTSNTSVSARLSLNIYDSV